MTVLPVGDQDDPPVPVRGDQGQRQERSSQGTGGPGAPDDVGCSVARPAAPGTAAAIATTTAAAAEVAATTPTAGEYLTSLTARVGALAPGRTLPPRPARAGGRAATGATRGAGRKAWTAVVVPAFPAGAGGRRRGRAAVAPVREASRTAIDAACSVLGP